jgi:hypothetical protein
MQLNEYLAMLAQALLIISLPILIVSAAYWLKNRADEIKSKLGKERLATLESVAGIAVRAAEQAGLNKALLGGAAKRERALQVTQTYLNSIGIRIDVATVASAVESEVLRQFNSGQPPVDSSASRTAVVDRAIEAAVLAAEQSGLKAVAAGAVVKGATTLAEQKKQYALSLAQKYLDNNGIKLDTSVVDGLLEAQIMRFKMQAAQAIGGGSGDQSKRMGGRVM